MAEACASRRNSKDKWRKRVRVEHTVSPRQQSCRGPRLDTAKMPSAGCEVEALSGRLSPLPKSRAQRGNSWRKRVRVEHTLDTAKMPSAGFEDREDHRTPFASAFIPSRLTNERETSDERRISDEDRPHLVALCPLW
jgi:hypothetical protein